MTYQRHRVIIAGAGPGDPELISVKALKALRSADVILYDALVGAELLTEAKTGCKLIYVGKRKDSHSFSQQQINELIVSYAREFKVVVRLKGGDPFVFGRGYEECCYVREAGFDVEVIPGISSAIAGPMAAGIPVTLRTVSESFWVVTGTTSSRELSGDLMLAAKSTATIVVLMGLSKLKEIMDIITEARSHDESVAIVEGAFTERQRSITGTASSIMETASSARIAAPAIIVVGSVVRHGNFAEILAADAVKMKVAV